MMRASTSSPAFDRSRQWATAWRVGAKWPFRWTRITASHSSSEVLANMRSRRKPALLTSTSSRPNASTAVATSASAWAQSATSAPLATASPPMAADGVDHLAGRTGRAAGAVDLGAEVVDDDLGSLPCELERVAAADAPPRAGHDHDPSVTDAHAADLGTAI